MEHYANNRRALLGCVLLISISGFLAGPVKATELEAAKILIIAGPCNHPPATHEASAGALNEVLRGESRQL